ncbi:MAG: M20 metallopeptidase family protein, partial [Limisphaerales bacterium]
MKRFFALFLATTVLAQDNISVRLNDGQKSAIKAWVQSALPALVDAYQGIHANPELSFEEIRTSELVATVWEGSGIKVTRRVGKTGVVGVLENGEGPTVLIRGDMDALPVTEKTGLPYASKVQIKRPDGTTTGAMHACGHDVHTTMVIGMGQMLVDLRRHWSGTVVFVAQPAEEIGKGAKAMIDDGLFERFPKPDFCLALHVLHRLPARSVGFTPGWCHANMDSVDITIYGKGGHGARPNQAVDPIVTAAHVITALQTIVSRRISPSDPGVITVGSIHGGTRHNIIPDEVKLQLTVRSYTDEVRKQLLEGIRQITTDICKTMRCPKEPTIVVEKDYVPAAYNHPKLTAAAVDVFRDLVGESMVFEMEPTMGAEDFSHYARTLKVPGLQYRVGTIAFGRYQNSLKP